MTTAVDRRRRTETTFINSVAVCGSSSVSDKDKLMAELFPKSDDKEYQEISQDAKETVKEQGNIEAHGILMITDAVQCSSCHNDATPEHGPSEEVKKKSQERHQLLQSHNKRICFFFNLNVQREKQVLAPKAPNCSTRRVRITKML